MEFISGDCGQIIGVIGGTDADLKAAQLRQCGAEFYGALREALYYGESDPIGSARSSRVLDQATHDAIGYVALEFPKPRPETVDKAVAAYNACVNRVRD